MRIREDVLTSASPERVWELAQDPTLHDLWNPHIVKTEIVGDETPRLGLRYRVEYELSGRRNEYEGEITEFSPPHHFAARLEERFQGDGSHHERFVEERYEITRRGARTHVLHDIHIHHSGVHPLLQLLIAFVMRFGKPVGQPVMERFRELAESDEPKTSRRSA